MRTRIKIRYIRAFSKTNFIAKVFEYVVIRKVVLMRSQILRRALWLLIALATLTYIGIAVIDLQLRSSATPYGIVSFEFCYLTDSCNTALVQWGSKQKALAMLSLGIDYLFLILYPAVIFIGLLLIAPSVPRNLLRFTVVIARSCFVMGLADAVENFALIQIIVTESGEFYGGVATIFAAIKFTIFAISLLWLLLATVKYVLLARNR